MNDSYAELLVRQKETRKMKVKKALAIAGIAAFAVFLFLPFPLLIIISMIMISALLFYLKRTSVTEYEYIYCEGEIDIDKISGRQSRKRVLTVSAEDMEILAPTDSQELSQYQNLQVYDFSSYSENKTYEIVTKVKGRKARVRFEPNDIILQGMKYNAPRKVFL